ncbi:DUF2490 domain-containing protein [Mucilaginibacter limnophilus]|uniref:DUF2490 domain-containing protein n=1 Tax=Mucilaginibacter limnophilus TaxID=1932778 RepID=A0A3S2V6C1_9SPHI|nr:DUF2490 domain-containing protein [Mucilaginibacter limnophilus]RVT98193.1 DUF2490 domain-containing protein [Mucilaginibacter limnophilus]
MRKTVLLMAIVCLLSTRLFAQSSQSTVWGAWFHTQRLSDKWGVAFDGQFRSADDVKYLRNILLRPSVAYYFDNNHVASLGYAYIGTNGRSPLDEKTFRPESRIWEQFVISHKVGRNISLSHRFRLEQRFLGNTSTGDAESNDNLFSQRFRYFVRGIVPFKKDSVFSKGIYLAAQNELFLNLQNKSKLNDSFYDQNRAFIAIGYRFSKKFDIEAGYLNHYSKSPNSIYITNHVAQLVVYTRF